MTRSALISDGYASVAQAAEFLAISPRQVYNLIHAQVLSHAQHGGKYVLPWRALKHYASERLTVGTVA